MSTTPTPRTNSKVVLCNYGEQRVSADFARQLERDLAARDTELARLRERAEQFESKLNYFTDATTKPHSIDDATMREWDLANKLAKLRALLAEVKNHHARGLEHVKNQERTLDEYAKEVADLRAQLQTATERAERAERERDALAKEIAPLREIVGVRCDAESNPSDITNWMNLVSHADAAKRIKSDLAALRSVADGLAEALEKCFCQLHDQQAMPDDSCDHTYKEALARYHAAVAEDAK